MKTDYAGIDYSLGQSNVDKSNGIHYGVISMHSVPGEMQEDWDYDYLKPTCPKCGNEVTDEMPEGWKEMELESYTEYGCDDYICATCKLLLDSSDVYSEEPLGWSYDKDGYKLSDCLDTDIFVLQSPFYTRAQYCGPCVPGAGNLDSPCELGPKCYCLGHDWFDGGQAPYPVFKVENDEQVFGPSDASQT